MAAVADDDGDLADQLKGFRLLGGMDATDLWPYLGNLALPAWVLLAVAPRWKHTPALTLIPPFVHAFVYAMGVVSLMAFPDVTSNDQQAPPQPDFSTLEGVVEMFKDPNAVFVGWTHYVVFDLLVGRSIAFHAVEAGASTAFHVLVVVPCLFLTLVLGPAGWLAYRILSAVFLVKTDGGHHSTTPAPKTKEN